MKIPFPKFALSKRTGKVRLALAGLGLALALAGGFAGWRLTQSAHPVASPAEDAPKPAETQDRPPESHKEEARVLGAPAEEPKTPATPAEAAPSNSQAAPTQPQADQHAPPHEGAADSGHASPREGKSAEKAGEKPVSRHEGKKDASFVPLPLTPPSEVEKLIRRLQTLQERVAIGDGAAFSETPRLLRTIAQTFAAQPPEVWSKPENARALVLYLLSGGSSALGRKILGLHTFAPAEEALAKGAIGYLEGAEGVERDFLLSLDPQELDPSLGAQVAFVQSTLLAPVDRIAALRKLDMARLLSPGGLVEEAALRRQVGLLAATEDFDKFAELARQYWSRFRSSPYADNFLRQFMLAVARVSQSIRVAEWTQLDEFIESLAPDTRRGLYLTMAQAAAIGGNVDLGEMAARRALDLTPDEGPDRRRSLLYRAAALVGAAKAEASADLLKGIDRDKLGPGDQPLFDAVAMVSARMFRAPETAFSATPPGVANAFDSDLARAEKGLKEADVVMASMRKSMERKRP
jgi:chemotaxis protein MotC